MNIEYYHNSGMLPDMYYYQLNSKTADENYREQKSKKGSYNKNKSFLENLIINMLKAYLYQTLNEVLDGIIPKN